VLSKNYSFTEKVNSIQQLFAYCLLTGTEVDIGEIIYSDLATRLTNKSRKKYVSYPRFVSCSLEVLLGSNYTHDENFRSSPTILRLPSTQLDDGTRKSQLLPKDKKSDPKDSVGNKEPIDTRLPSTVSDEGTDDKYQANQTQSARLRKVIMKKFLQLERRYEDISPTDEEAYSLPPNKEQPKPSHAQESDSDSSSPELKKYDNILPLTKRQLVKYLRKVSQVLFNRITKYQWEKHKEAAVSYADLRPSIEGYYEENVDHVYQTDKLVKATMNYLDKNSTKRADLLKALNGITEILKAVQEAVKEDHSLVEIVKATLDAKNDHLATWAKSSTSMV
ncbi:hypothetical protein Tco_0304123, partial [Tanacetum coccineum]